MYILVIKVAINLILNQKSSLSSIMVRMSLGTSMDNENKMKE